MLVYTEIPASQVIVGDRIGHCAATGRKGWLVGQIQLTAAGRICFGRGMQRRRQLHTLVGVSVNVAVGHAYVIGERSTTLRWCVGVVMEVPASNDGEALVCLAGAATSIKVPLRHIRCPATHQALKYLYLQSKGTRCLYCGTDNIEGRSFQSEAGGGRQNIACLDCAAEWDDVFTVADVDTSELPQGLRGL